MEEAKKRKEEEELRFTCTFKPQVLQNKELTLKINNKLGMRDPSPVKSRYKYLRLKIFYFTEKFRLINQPGWRTVQLRKKLSNPR